MSRRCLYNKCTVSISLIIAIHQFTPQIVTHMNINRNTKPQLVEMSILIVLTRISDTHTPGRQISTVNNNSM